MLRDRWLDVLKSNAVMALFFGMMHVDMDNVWLIMAYYVASMTYILFYWKITETIDVAIDSIKYLCKKGK